MAELKAATRNKLSDSTFGLPRSPANILCPIKATPPQRKSSGNPSK